MKKRRTIPLIVVAVLVVLLLPLVLIVLVPAISAAAAEWTIKSVSGFPVTAKSIEIDLFPPKVDASGLELPSAGAGVVEPAMTIEALSVSLDPGRWWDDAPTWWSGTAAGAVIRLARDEKGDTNWPAARSGNDSSADQSRDQQRNSPIYSFNSVHVDDLNLYRITPAGTQQFEVENLALDRNSDERLNLSLNGVWRDQLVSLTGSLPLPSSEEARDIDLRAQLPGNRVTVNGVVGHDGIVPGRADITIEGDDLDFMEMLLDRDLSALEPLSIAGELRAPKPGHWELTAQGEIGKEPLEFALALASAGPQARDGRIELDQLKVIYGANDIAAVGEINPKTPSVTLAITSSYMDVDRLLGLAGPAPETPDEEATDPLAFTERWAMDLTFTLETVKYGAYRARDIEGNLKAGDGRLDINAELTRLAPSGSAAANDPLWKNLTPMTVDITAAPQNGRWELDPLQITVGDDDIQGRITLDPTSQPLRLDGQLQASVIDLNRVRTTPRAEQAREGTWEEVGASGAADATGNNADDGVFSSDPIDWTWLDAATVDVGLTVRELRFNQTVFRDSSLPIKLSEGVLRIDPLSADLEEGGVRGHLQVERLEAGARIDTELIVTNLQPADIGMKNTGLIDGGNTDLLLNFDSHGDSPQALASNLRGEIALEVKRATVRNDVFEVIGSDLLVQTAELINPFAKRDEQTELECAAAYFVAKDGVLQSADTLVIETSKMKIRGSGQIDLNKEELTIDFSPSARRGLGVSLGDISSVVRIGGTLSRPSVEPDPAGVVKAGASVGAAMLTGGLSLLAQGLFDRARNAAGTACGKIFERAPETGVPEPIARLE